MTLDWFSQFSRAFPEALLLLTNRGEIIGANQAIATVFHCNRKEIIGKNLLDFVRETPEDVLAYLKLCSQSSKFVIGSLTFLGAEDRRLFAYRTEGAVIQPKTADSPAINILRFQKKDVAVHDFSSLNEKIEELGKEIRKRKEAEFNLLQNNAQLKKALRDLEFAQIQLIQTEKMSSLGQLVAGIAHEINNPVNFIHGNLTHIRQYLFDLIELNQLYQTEYSQPSFKIHNHLDAMDFDFLVKDAEKIIDSMKSGTQRILNIVRSLRTFSRLDESEIKQVNIHDGIESTLEILQYRLQPETEIKIIKDYQDISLIECYAGQLNQVFLNLLNNAIDALIELDRERTPDENKPNARRIWIQTEQASSDRVKIRVRDNGAGISATVLPQIFNPFFTTKPVGRGTGLGLAISYQIVTQMHNGSLHCHSIPGKGTEFTVEIPIFQAHTPPPADRSPPHAIANEIL